MIQKKTEGMKSGIIWAPFVIAEHTEESLKDYKEFMAKYKKQHEVCPKCGSIKHSTTFAGFIMISDRREEYKNLNDCVCFDCGDKHTCHDRISVEQFEKQ